MIRITLAHLLLLLGLGRPVGADEWPVFERARREGKPILLVVGDWRTRPILGESERFVTVFVDRDERPDVAETYSSALVLLEEEGGRPRMPFRLVLTPDGRPVCDVHRDELDRLAAEFKDRRAALEAKAGVTTLALREAQVPRASKGLLRAEVVAKALRGLVESYDARQGRFGLFPGPPPPGALPLLFEEHARTGNEQALKVATSCLDVLARAGLPVREEGAARLAANALLLDGYLLAHAVTGEAAHRRSAEALADWALGSLRVPGGGFRAALAADAADERVFAGANGLMIGALARLGRAGDLEAAREAAAFFAGRSASLPRFALGAEGHGSAFLEDYALLAEGLLQLHLATEEARWREAAVSLVDVALGRFLDPASGSFFDTDASHGPSIVRLRNGYDGALPAGNAVMASVLLRLGRSTGETRYADLARKTVASFLADLEQAPRGLETLAAVAGELLPPAAASDAAEGPLPSQIAVGPVEISVSLSAPRVAPGGTVEARIALKPADGWRVVPHGTGGKERVGLTVGVPAGGLAVATIRYAEGAQPVTLSLRVPAAATPGERRVRFRVGFQACRGQECRSPDSALLEAPLEVSAR